MSEKRKDYIDQLLSDLKLLEERLLTAKENETLPFSFFSASFDRIEKISRSLHELEMMQIEEMKGQMQRLVQFLSESSTQQEQPKQPEYLSRQDRSVYSTQTETPEHSESMSQREQYQQPEQPDQPDQPEQLKQPEYPKQHQQPDQLVQREFSPSETGDLLSGQKKNEYSKRIILPEYKDPRIVEPVSHPVVGAKADPSEKNGSEKPIVRSLNDTIQAPPALLDLKRGISLNDRFLFQRELFNNDRAEMNRVMESLSTFSRFEEAENYLRSEQGWDFENQEVKEFLRIIRKSFE